MQTIWPRRLRFVTILLLPVMLTAFVVQHPAILTGIELFKQVLDITTQDYLKQLPADSLYVRAARGMIRELHDPFSEVFTPDEAALFNQAMSGRLAGVGIGIAPTPGGLVVLSVVPSGPAANSGLQAGDLIVQIDTVDVRSGDTARVLGRIKGPIGTSVALHVFRSGIKEPMFFSITRAAVYTSAVPYTVLFPNHVGYVPLSIFNRAASADCSAAIERLVQAGATRLVLDLRNNPGGETDQAIAVSSLFLRQGQRILTTRSPHRDDDTYDVTSDPEYPTIPLVVLVNGRSASSSEIVTGALQDHDRATIIGTTTFGKGIGQNTYHLPEGYLLKLTTIEWLTPAGRFIQRDRTTLGPGGFADINPDTVESDSAIHARPRFKSDAGRTLYGGGGIVPDLIVRASPTDPQLTSALANARNLFQAVLARYGAEVRSKLHRDFVVTPAIRATVIRRLRAVGVKLDDTTIRKGRYELDYLIGSRLTAQLFGDSTATKKYMMLDPQLQAALATLKKLPETTSSPGTP